MKSLEVKYVYFNYVTLNSLKFSCILLVQHAIIKKSQSDKSFKLKVPLLITVTVIISFSL